MLREKHIIYIMNQLIWSIQFEGTNTVLLDRDPNSYRARSCCSVREQFKDMESRSTLLTRSNDQMIYLQLQQMSLFTVLHTYNDLL